jgi:hypothetical protein
MNRAHNQRSKKQRTKAQRQHQNRSKIYKRSKHAEPRPLIDTSPPPHNPNLLDLTNVIDALTLYLHNTIQTHEQPKLGRRPPPSFNLNPSLFDARDTRTTSTLPTIPDIRSFVQGIIERRHLSAETVVVAVVLLTRTGVRLRSSNWARLLLVSFLLANKEAEDVFNVWNVRFVGIIPDLPLFEINLLEMEFLKSIKYRLHVEPSTFREYSDLLWQFLEPPEKFAENPKKAILENSRKGILENSKKGNPENPKKENLENSKKGNPEFPQKGRRIEKNEVDGIQLQQTFFSMLGKEGDLGSTEVERPIVQP